MTVGLAATLNGETGRGKLFDRSSETTVRALSVMQPWAFLIVEGLKDIENRSWQTKLRGRVLVHAGLKVDRDADDDLRRGIHPVTGERFAVEVPSEWRRGGIVGSVEIAGCVDGHDSDWFVGPYGFLLRNPVKLPFKACKGALNFFEPRFADAA